MFWTVFGILFLMYLGLNVLGRLQFSIVKSLDQKNVQALLAAAAIFLMINLGYLALFSLAFVRYFG